MVGEDLNVFSRSWVEKPSTLQSCCDGVGAEIFAASCSKESS